MKLLFEDIEVIVLIYVLMSSPVFMHCLNSSLFGTSFIWFVSLQVQLWTYADSTRPCFPFKVLLLQILICICIPLHSNLLIFYILYQLFN